MGDQVYRQSRVHRPSVSQLSELAAARGLDSTPEELAVYRDHIAQILTSYDKVDDYPAPTLPVKYPRTPGYRPTRDENKYNAWYYKTNIKGALEGKLAGKTIVVKDNIPVAGVPMMNGSALLEGYVPEFDATVVTRVLDAGATIAGKSVCEHLCLSGSSHTPSSGAVLNPHDTTRSAGGSSNGSAVLVAAGEVDMAFGGDQGGSIRLPSCWCGTVGLKPTHGLVPYTGIMPIEASVDHVGPITKTVADCALLLEVIAGYDCGLDARQPRDLTVPKYTELLGDGGLSGVRVGVVEEGFTDCEADVASLVKAATGLMSVAGASVTHFSLPIHADGNAIWTPVCMEGAVRTMVDHASSTLGMKGFYPTSMIDALRKGYQTKSQDMSHALKCSILFGDYVIKDYGLHYYGRAMNLVRTLTQKYDEALTDYDVLVMPTIKFKAPKLPPPDASVDESISQAFCNIANTSPFDVTGHPVLSINAGFSEGLPVGMQIIGRHFDEATVLRVARAFEQQRDKQTE